MAEKSSSVTLPKAKRLYFYGTGVFDTDLIFDFETILDRNKFAKKLYDYVINTEDGVCYDCKLPGTSVISGTVDNYSPPKVNPILCLNLTDEIPEKINITIKDGKKIECQISTTRVDIYAFNCGILHFRVDISEEHWQNLDVLKQIRYFIQRHQHSSGEFGTDMETIFGSSIKKLKTMIKAAIKVINPPLLKTPFLDFTQISDEIKTNLFWTHCTIVGIMEQNFDVSQRHYHDILLDLNPGGIENFSSTPNIFAYVESGDSLIVLQDTKDIQERGAEAIAEEDWISLLAIHHYTWKISWELDRGFNSILNLVVSHLKHKRTEKYRDVYAVNALINQIHLFFDTHEARNITSTYYGIAFIEKMSESWRTGEIMDAARKKMNNLRDLIGQLDEIEETLRSKRSELFLTLLGVFTFGSLILDIIGSLSIAEKIGDIGNISLGVGIPFIFAVITYLMLKERKRKKKKS